VLLNVLLVTTRPAVPKVSAEVKMSYEQFAKQVTQHLLDTSYITYADSTLALLKDELAPNVKKQLIAQDMLAKSEDDLRSTAKTLIEQHQVSAVKISECTPSELDQNGMMPVDVKGMVAIHSAAETGPAEPVQFEFKFKIGARVGPDGKALMTEDGKTPLPCIVEFKDVSPKPTSN